jgi:hypothetical protein
MSPAPAFYSAVERHKQVRARPRADIYNQGDKVKPTENTKTPRTATGLFVTLRGLFRVRGSGAPKFSPRTLILSTFAITVGVLALITSPALAAKQYVPDGVPDGTFGSEGAGDGQFVEPAGVAVSESSEPLIAGDVYVVDKGNNRVERFSSSGSYLSQFNASGTLPGEGAAAPTGRLSGPEEIAADNSGDALDPSLSDVYVGDNEHHVVDKFSATGEYKGQITGTCASGPCSGAEAFGELHGVAVDPSGNLWVYQGEPEAQNIDEFTAAGAFVRSFSTGRGVTPALAVDSAGDIYVISGGEEVLKFDPVRGEQLAEFDPGAHALALNPATSELLVDHGESIDLYGPFGEPYSTRTQTFPATGLAESHGIGVGADGTAYASQRAADSVDIFNFVLVPTVSTGAATQVSSTGETLHGTVDPEGLALSDCRLEYSIYGTPAGVYLHTVPCAQTPAEIGSGTAPVAVSADITGLRPVSTYHFRLTASNSNGAKSGSDETFVVTQNLGPAALSLPDGRAYELVSTMPGTEVDPPAVGEPISYELELGEIHGNPGGYRAAANGEGVAYVGGPPSSGEGGTGVSHNTDGNHYLAKREATGWADANIEPEARNPAMEDLSADLSLQIFNSNEPVFKAAHGGPADCLGATGSIVYARSGGIGAPSFSPLFTATKGPNECYAEEAGISADDSHILLDSPYALTSTASPTGGFEERNLYDLAEGQMHQVNILPDGRPQPSPNAVFGSYTGEVSFANYGDDLGAVSGDGSRVFWTDRNTGIVYVRENDAQVEEGCTAPPQPASKACTVQVSAGSARYWTASPDGHYVYYTENGELDRFDTLAGSRVALAGAGAEVQGVIGTNETGEAGAYVYFVADGVLAGQNAEGQGPTAEQPNLYMAHAGLTTFIATLSSRDNELIGASFGNENAGDWQTEPGLRTAELAPNGQAVAFMSKLSLTGYDNYGPVSENEEHEVFYVDQPQVFVYETSTSQLVCASCNPTGQPPVPTAEAWEGSRGGYVNVSGANTFMPRWINADGTQVYFNTSQPLVSRDSNHRQDLYEWQSDGSGGCARSAGCVELISGGDAPADAYFLDASASGDDVFFTSREQLLPSAQDETVKVYDARVGGGISETALACTGTGCQGVAPAPPIFATPASVTFAGVGNFPPSKPAVKTKSKPKKTAKCKRGFTKKKGKCVKQPRKKPKRSAAKKGRK